MIYLNGNIPNLYKYTATHKSDYVIQDVSSVDRTWQLLNMKYNTISEIVD